MENEKDRFGDKMRLVERAKEDIYFAAKDRELIEKLKARLVKLQPRPEAPPLPCPKCHGKLESYSFMEIILDRCPACGGIWFDRGELEQILKKVSRGPLAALAERFLGGGSAKDRKKNADSLQETALEEKAE